MWDDKKTFRISKRWHLASPPSTFTRNQNMEKIMEKGNRQHRWMGDMAMGECENRKRKLVLHCTNIL